MFAKDKVTQSMLDAVNQVLGQEQVDEATSEKVPTATGMKVYGHRYGDSAKARRDQTKSSVDTLKGPKAKEMKEEEELDEASTKAHRDKVLSSHDEFLKHTAGNPFFKKMRAAMKHQGHSDEKIDKHFIKI